MKRNLIITITTSLLFLIAGAFIHLNFHDHESSPQALKIGFIYDGDESIPYTNNFIRSQTKLKEIYGNKIEIIAKNNIIPDEIDENLDELAQDGCKLIFTSSYSHALVAKEYAEKYPDIQFCQAMGDNASSQPILKNYHTFMPQIYQGFYLLGITAGYKLKELVENNTVSEEQAKLGFVATYPYPGSVSSFTAFLLGAISVFPKAKMTVVYTYYWSNFQEEKKCTQRLIDDGCLVIAQSTDTTGPAIACEENYEKNVFHLGYNQSMIDIAPKTSITDMRINWTPYITAAVKAVFENKSIESKVKGKKNGMDMWAGLDLNWIQLLAFNSEITPEGCQKEVERACAALKKNKIAVFKGDFIASNPYDEEDRWNLKDEYKENEKSSAPTFFYIIKERITIDEQSLF
ncbi:MAG: BMP family ABC transporter substrate-binding protein [Treponema sp.]|nr:BMP family ABC transporter substrate-binding protein [Treponema sp.]